MSSWWDERLSADVCYDWTLPCLRGPSCRLAEWLSEPGLHWKPSAWDLDSYCKYKQYKCTVNVPHKHQYTRPCVFNDEIQWYIHKYLQSTLFSTAQLHTFDGGLSSVPPIPAGIWSFQWILVEWNLPGGLANLFIPVFSTLVDAGIYTSMFPGIGRNRILLELFICLLQLIAKQ